MRNRQAARACTSTRHNTRGAYVLEFFFKRFILPAQIIQLGADGLQLRALHVAHVF